jgi:hypothetical protein
MELPLAAEMEVPVGILHNDNNKSPIDLTLGSIRDNITLCSIHFVFHSRFTPTGVVRHKTRLGARIDIHRHCPPLTMQCRRRTLTSL